MRRIEGYQLSQYGYRRGSVPPPAGNDVGEEPDAEECEPDKKCSFDRFRHPLVWESETFGLFHQLSLGGIVVDLIGHNRFLSPFQCGAEAVGYFCRIDRRFGGG